MEGDAGEDKTDAKGLLWKKKTVPPTVPKVIVPYSIDSPEYYMSNKHRGKCVIINQKVFEPHTSLKERKGTDKDASSLYSCFRELDFDVELKQNLKGFQIESWLEEISKDESYHSQSDCFVCCILTHGDEGVLFGTDGKFSTENVFEHFRGDRCTSLAGKPKIFFIQACQGDRLDGGVSVMFGRDRSDSAPVSKIPTRADFLIVYSTVPGYYSWRNTSEGSWFVQALCEVLKKNAKTEDLLSMMTQVNYKVAFCFESNCPNDSGMHMMKQVPCVTSTLTRKVYFHAKY